MARIIKRYSNRKLYDLQDKRYVRLEEVVALVRGGEEVRVVDSVSGEDQTVQTLGKALAGEERTGEQPLPQGILQDVIRWGGKLKTATLDQFEEGVERLVRASIERWVPVQTVSAEMASLKERIAQLEARLGALETRAGDASTRPAVPRRRAGGQGPVIDRKESSHDSTRSTRKTPRRGP